jgi:hypothetical protein
LQVVDARFQKKLGFNLKSAFSKETMKTNLDDFVKRRHSIESVMPAEAGIQLFQEVLDPGFRRGDASWDFLRDHQFSFLKDPFRIQHSAF